jgi:hypothetical protein
MYIDEILAFCALNLMSDEISSALF